MKFLIKRDIVFTFKSIFIKNIFMITVFFIMNIIIISNLHNRIKNKYLIFENLKGVPYFNLSQCFQLPLIWFLINLYIIYVLSSYFYYDIKNNGIYILTRVKNIKYFYLAKIFWIIYNVLIYYILIFLIIIIISKKFLNNSLKYVIIENINVNIHQLTIKMFLLYVTTTICLVLLHNTLAFIINPIYSYLVTLFIILLSVFSDNNLLPAQHSLILRHIPFDNIHNLSYMKSLMYNASLFSFLMIILYIILKNKDIL